MLPNRMYLTELLSRLIYEIQSLKNVQNIFALQPQNFSLLTFFCRKDIFKQSKFQVKVGLTGMDPLIKNTF